MQYPTNKWILDSLQLASINNNIQRDIWQTVDSHIDIYSMMINQTTHRVNDPIVGYCLQTNVQKSTKQARVECSTNVLIHRALDKLPYQDISSSSLADAAKDF